MKQKKEEKILDRFLENPWLICDKNLGCGKKIEKDETVIEMESLELEDFGKLKVLHKVCFVREFDTAKKNY